MTVVRHPSHTFDEGYCACGYRCEHTDGFDADGKCKICDTHAVASVGGELFTELSVAFARANELAKTEENVTVNIIYDLGGLAETGYATGKITLDINGHDLRSSRFYAGKEDEDGNVIAEGDLTIVDSSESKSGGISSVYLLGGKLTLRDVSAYIVDINGGEANISGGKPGTVTVYGGKADISGGGISQVSAQGGETYISGGLTEQLRIKGGKTYVSGGTVNDFRMFDGGEIYISDGGF